jgi:prepilin-type N-terminal cleavage/methylation domain-containing protein
MKTSCLRLKNKQAFTLIELLVVVAIISVLTSIGISAYTAFNEKQILNKTVEELKTNLRLVQAKAVNNEKPQSCCGSDPLYGWKVNFDNSPPTYYCSCDDGTTNCTSDEREIVSLDYNRDGSDDFAVTTSGGIVTFYALGGTDLSANYDIAVDRVSGSDPKTIRIYPTGEIERLE